MSSSLVSKDWVQLGKGKTSQGKPVYYRKKEIYEMAWTDHDLNLSEYMIAASKFGGPLALTRDARKALRVTSHIDSKPFIFIYSSSGILLSKFMWKQPGKEGYIMAMGWTKDEHLLCVSSEAQVYIFDVFGKCIMQFGFVNVPFLYANQLTKQQKGSQTSRIIGL